MLVIGAIGLTAFLVQRGEAEGTKTYLVLIEGNEVIKDFSGRTLKVSGPTPMAVLNAYCEAASGDDTLEPVRLIPSNVQEGRLGIISLNGGKDLVAIRIRENTQANLWVAGDGVTPITMARAPVTGKGF